MRPGPRRRTALRFLVLWLLLAAASSLWALATPMMGAPDEPSHVIKAAAVVRGQLTGEGGAPPVDRSKPGTPTIVTVPKSYRVLDGVAACFAFKPNRAANCGPGFVADDEPARVGTYAGRYPPLYYALVGWPSLALDGPSAVFGMRAASSGVCALFLAAGIAVVHRARGGRLVLLGAALAVTPMVLFMAGTINPSGLEISSAFALWAALLALALDPDGGRIGSRLATATVAAAVLVNVRASSPVWVVLAVLAALALMRWQTLREILRHPFAKWVPVAAVASGGLALAWVLKAGGLAAPMGLYPEYDKTTVVTRDAFGRSQRYLREMVGVFGWLDTPAPLITFLLWSAAIFTLLVLTVATVRSARHRAVLLLLVLLVVVLPVGLQLPGADDVGLIWQGRYLLPLAVGVPLLLGLLLARDPLGLVGPLRIERVVGPMLVVAHVAAFYFAGRRYAAGEMGPVIVTNARWDAPLGLWPLTAALLVVSVLALVVAARWTEPAASSQLGQTTEEPTRDRVDSSQA